jgi:hypothetical protein
LGLCWSERVEFHMYSIGWRPLNITDLSLNFVDDPNNSGRERSQCGHDWGQGIHSPSSLQTQNKTAQTINWTFRRENIDKQLTVKFPEPSSEKFVKKLLKNIGEGRFSEFHGDLLITVFLGENSRSAKSIGPTIFTISYWVWDKLRVWFWWFNSSRGHAVVRYTRRRRSGVCAFWIYQPRKLQECLNTKFPHTYIFTYLHWQDNV